MFNPQGKVSNYQGEHQVVRIGTNKQFGEEDGDPYSPPVE